jgi:hypothetical protein
VHFLLSYVFGSAFLAGGRRVYAASTMPQTVAWGEAEAPVIEDVRLVRPSLRAKFGVKLSECVENALALSLSVLLTLSHLLLPDSTADQRHTTQKPANCRCCFSACVGGGNAV